MSHAAGPRLVVARVVSPPAGLDALAREAAAEGFAFLDRLRDEWRTGANRFDRPGEALYAARRGARLVGVAGLNRDPYVDDPTAGRLRHLFVAGAARRAGVGRRLIAAVRRDAAAGPFRRLRLRTRTASADRFYRALGFEPVAGDPTCTHRLSLC